MIKNIFISKNLYLLLKIWKYRQEDLAEKLEVSRPTIARILAENTITGLQFLETLSKMTGLSFDELIYTDLETIKFDIPERPYRDRTAPARVASDDVVQYKVTIHEKEHKELTINDLIALFDRIAALEKEVIELKNRLK
jgi:transcriptional regulator with XRE-family HTH domain